VIIGPNHTGLGHPISFSQDIWKTPLGEVETDRAMAALFDGTGIVHDEKAHFREHSIEVIIPFLQRKMKDKSFKIFPIIMGDQSKKAAKAVADVLIPLMKGERTLQKENNGEKLKIAVIASCDFSHYVPEAFAKRHDKDIIDRVMSLDVNEFYDFICEHDSSLCGYGPVMVLMMAAKALNATGKLLDYRTSNDERKVRDAAVVGYAALTFTMQ